MKTIRLEVAESPKVLAARCISVHEDGGACPVGEGFRCPFHETYCTSVAPWMWEEVMEEEPAMNTVGTDVQQAKEGEGE